MSENGPRTQELIVELRALQKQVSQVQEGVKTLEAQMKLVAYFGGIAASIFVGVTVLLIVGVIS